MSTSSGQPTIQGVVFTLRIILFALASGLITFAMVTIAIVNPGDPQPGEIPSEPFLSYVAYRFLLGAVVGSFVVPRLIVATQIRQLARADNAERGATLSHLLLGLFQIKTIVSAAFYEGLGFFALITYLVEESVIVFPVALIALLGILLFFPTTSGVESWMESIERRIGEQRMMNP